MPLPLPLPLDVPSPRQNAQIEHAAEPARATLVSSEDNLIADDNRLPMRIKLCHKFTLHCLHFVREYCMDPGVTPKCGSLFWI